MKNVLCKNMYAPKITLLKRGRRIAIWVSMPNGQKYNIGDLKKDALPKKLSNRKWQKR